MISERFSSSAAYQYWELLPSPEGLVTYIQQKVCGQDELCKVKAKALNHADYLDMDYDTISQSLVLNAFWHVSPHSAAWEEKISIRQGSTKVDIGILANEKPTQPEELSLGGFLTILGEDAKPSTQYDPLFSPVRLKLSRSHALLLPLPSSCLSFNFRRQLLDLFHATNWPSSHPSFDIAIFEGTSVPGLRPSYVSHPPIISVPGQISIVSY